MPLTPQTHCKLIPYKRKDILSAQELKQKLSWGISQFKVDEIWSITQGDGVTVAILDSGCQLHHPDLTNNLLQGYNFIDPTKPPEDDNGHGTSVAGIIAAENNTIGVCGTSPKSKIIPIKVLDAYGDGEIEIVAKAIRWAIKQKADMICLSLGCPKPIAALKWAIKAADSNKIPVFCAAGNLGKSEHLLYPSNYNETIAVGAIDKNLKRADYSNTGKNLDFMGPGTDVLTTSLNNWYALFSGTSAAAPFVCGLAALLLSYKRKHNLDIPLDCANDYRNFFKQHTVDLKVHAGNKKFQGYGVITVDKVLAYFKSR